MRKRWGEGGMRVHEKQKEDRGREKTKSTKKDKEGHSRKALTEN